MELDDLVAETRPRRNVDLVGLVALLDLAGLQFLEAVEASLALGLAPLGVGSHPLELVLDGLLAGGFLLGFLGEAFFLGFQPLGIVALEGNAFAAVQLQDPAGHVVEKVAVVGDGHHGAAVVVQEALQPGHRFGIEVVGRLVQQQHVGVG